jgi:hypothetical protein
MAPGAGRGFRSGSCGLERGHAPAGGGVRSLTLAGKAGRSPTVAWRCCGYSDSEFDVERGGGGAARRVALSFEISRDPDDAAGTGGIGRSTVVSILRGSIEYDLANPICSA